MVSVKPVNSGVLILREFSILTGHYNIYVFVDRTKYYLYILKGGEGILYKISFLI